MTQPTADQIIDAVIVGHPNIGQWLGREITAEAIRRATMRRADTASLTITPTPANAASGQDGAQTALQRDTVDMVAVDAPIDGVIVNAAAHALDAPVNDKMEWLSDFAGAVKPIDPAAFETPDTAREKRLSRLRKETDAASHERGRWAGVNPDDLQRKLSKMSPQRRKVWAWLDTINVTHDEPSCHDAAAATGISHQTSNKVLKEYRNTYGLYRG